MTKLEHFNESARAMERGKWLGVQSVSIHERGQIAIRESRKLLSEIAGGADPEERDPR